MKGEKAKLLPLDKFNIIRQMIGQYCKNALEGWHRSNRQQHNVSPILQKAALIKSGNIFSRAFYCNPDIMVITTLKGGCFIEVNAAFVAITGYERHEAIGRTVYDLGIWAITEERHYMLEQIQEKGNIQGFEHTLRLKSGEIRNFCLSAEVIEINNEALIITTYRDITESKRMEEALRLSEERFYKAFNACPIPMTITTLEQGQIIDSNDSFNNMYGSTREKVEGQSSLEIFWLNAADRNLVIQKIIENGLIRDMEINFRNKLGEPRLGLLSAELFNIMGNQCILSIFTDITELKKMEIEIARLDRLNLVGEMAASIGHEIRNPMTTVRGYLQLMRENKNYNQPTESYDLMIEELDRANSIITEFLSLAKNKMVELKVENLNSIIIKLLPLIQTKVIERDQDIKLELNALPDLLLDKEEIRQLIFNLVDNGLESMSSAGIVTVKTFVKSGKVVLAVQDQGHGIDKKLLDKLGTPFFTTKKQGTGLGLAVCYRIAARHNANIDIETGSNGTTFYVRFPILTTSQIEPEVYTHIVNI